MAAAPKPEVVRALWRHMNERFDATVVYKRDAAEMRAVSWALELMGILDKEDFLRRFATTIGRRIYLPFTPGEPKEGWDLWTQITNSAHEHQHVVQLDREGKVRFAWKYLQSDAARAQLEAEALTCNMELHFWRYGVLPKPEQLVEGLAAYSLSKKDIGAARARLESSALTIGHGGLITKSGKAAIKWLDENAPDLRAHALA